MNGPHRDHPVTTSPVTSEETGRNGYRIRWMRLTRPASGRTITRDDGSVVVPASLAGEVVRILAAHLDARIRTDGGELSPAARWLLVELQAAADRDELNEEAQPGSATGSAAPHTGTVEVTVNEAAALLECSTRWVRALIAAGCLPARRAGARLWLINADGLDHHRHQRPEEGTAA